MRQSARILFNTATMFGRMGFTFFVGLYATRVLLNVLGHSDYGILAALGATGALLIFLGYALNMSAQRYLAYELGREDEERLREVFSSSMVLFAGLGLVVLVVGVLVEPIVIRAVQIPPGRETAATWVFYLTLLNLVSVIVVTPYRSVVNARQAMGQIALYESLRSILRLVCVLLLFVVEGDALVVYSVLMLLAALLRSVAMVVVCAIRFPESRFRLSKLRVATLVRIASFTRWSALLTVGNLVYGHASVVLLSIAFSPVVAAAYAIAVTVGEYHTNFSRVLPRVVQPAMTTLEARGDRSYVQALTILTGRYACIGVLLVVVPLMLETEGVLRLWLGSYPEQTPFFVRMAMLWLTIQVTTSGFDEAVYAHGDMAPYALRITALWLGTLAVACLCVLAWQLPPWSVAVTILVTTLVQTPLRVRYGGSLIGLGFGDWARDVLGRIAVPALAGLVPAWLVHGWLEDGWPRYVAVAAIYLSATLPATWWFAVGERERRALARIAASGLGRLRGRAAR